MLLIRQLMSRSDPFVPALTLCSLVLLVLVPSSARAEKISYNLTMSSSPEMLESPNDPMVALMASWQTQHDLTMARAMPSFQLENTSDSAQITAYSITIGDTDFTYDFGQLLDTSPGIGFSVKQVGQLVELEFTNFDPGEFVRFKLNISPLDPNAFPYPDYRMVLFQGNGPDPSNNAVVGVTFDEVGTNGPKTISEQLPNYAVHEPMFTGVVFHDYSTMDMVQIFPLEDEDTLQRIPEPQSIVLLLIGSLGLLVMAGRGLRITR